MNLLEAYNEVYSNLSESHYKVGDKVTCKASGMTGKIVKVDPEEKGKYYTVKREDGKSMKYAPDELKKGGNGGAPKGKEEKFHTSLDKLVHKTFGSSPEEKKMKEETDLFDYVLEYLVAEGYVDTNENALVIMANMSEEWRESIVEELEQLDELSIDTLRRARKERFNRVDELEKSGLLDLTGDDEDKRGRKKLRRTQRAIARKTAPGKPDDPHKGAKAKLNMEMEYDVFDAILEHLVAEGFADTNENALVIMSNMSGEWRESIVEEIISEAWKPKNQQKINRQIERANKKEDTAKFQRKPEEANRQWDRQRAMRFGKKMSELGSR